MGLSSGGLVNWEAEHIHPQYKKKKWKRGPVKRRSEKGGARFGGELGG